MNHFSQKTSDDTKLVKDLSILANHYRRMYPENIKTEETRRVVFKQTPMTDDEIIQIGKQIDQYRAWQKKIPLRGSRSTRKAVNVALGQNQNINPNLIPLTNSPKPLPGTIPMVLPKKEPEPVAEFAPTPRLDAKKAKIHALPVTSWSKAIIDAHETIVKGTFPLAPDYDGSLRTYSKHYNIPLNFSSWIIGHYSLKYRPVGSAMLFDRVEFRNALLSAIKSNVESVKKNKEDVKKATLERLAKAQYIKHEKAEAAAQAKLPIKLPPKGNQIHVLQEKISNLIVCLQQVQKELNGIVDTSSNWTPAP